MSIKLKPHNEETYGKVKEKLNESNKVAVIHPTGTGKMYIALKMLEDNKEKKAVYIAPSNPILHDVKKNIFSNGMDMSDFPNLKRITYQKLMKLSDEEIEKLDTDIIILDEFHHCGAPEWGRGVERLMQRNPNAKILGLSATPLRYFDGVRDMADELFENNVASEMTLEEAIEKDILPEATYVSTLYGYDAELESMQINIDKIKDKSKKEEAQNLFNTLKEKLDENTKNLPELFEEHLSNKSGKYIIFCKNIEDMKEKMEQADKMFGSVNSNITVRGVSSKIKDNDKILSSFEKDNDEDSLKLLYSVDMLNEGYHIKDLDGVVMMRPTFSPTIFTQQLGRALTVGGENTPVVLDLVNNFDTCKIIEDFAERMRQYKGKEGTRLPNEEKESRVSIFDKTKEFREIANKITELSKRTVSLEEKIDIFEKYFHQENQEIDGQTMFDGYPIGQWAIQIRNTIKRFNEGKSENGITISEKQLERLDNLGILDRQIDSTIDEKIDMLVKWIEKYPKAKNMHSLPEYILRDYSSNEEEYVAITEEYSKMQKYYEYVRYRHYSHKLSEQQVLECKEGNLGGPFGYSTQIEEIAKKIGLSDKDTDYIITNYGTIENFKELYRNKLLHDEKDYALAYATFRSIIDIDFNPNSKNYDKLCQAIGIEKKGELYLYSSQKIDEILKTLTPREEKALKMRFGILDGKTSTLEETGNELNVTRERVRQIEAKAIRKLRYPTRMKTFKYDLTKNNDMLTDEEKRLINELKDNIFSSDMIFSNNPCELTQDDEKSEDILKAIHILKNKDVLFKERKEQQDIEREQRYKISLEDTNISKEAYDYLKGIGIEKVGDLIHIRIKDELNLINNLGKEGYIDLVGQLANYYDGIAEEYRERLENISEDNGKTININWAFKQHQDDFETPIEDLNLSVRAFNCLYRRGIRTLADIASLTEEELKNVRNLGNKSVEEVIQKLGEFGLTTRKEENVEDIAENIQSNMQHENNLLFEENTEIDSLELEEKNSKAEDYEGVYDYIDEEQSEDIDQEIEETRIKRDKLQAEMEQMQLKIKEMQELMNSYDKLLGGEKTTSDKENPEFKDE